MLLQDVPLVIVTVPVISLDKSPTHLNPTTTFVSTLVFPDVYAYTVISPEPSALFCVPMLIVTSVRGCVGVGVAVNVVVVDGVGVAVNVVVVVGVFVGVCV